MHVDRSSATALPSLDLASPAASRQASQAMPRNVGPPAPLASGQVADPLSLTGLPACVADARTAALRAGDGPPDPAGYAALHARLARAAPRLPPEARRAVAEPLLKLLDRLGPSGYARLLAEDPRREGPAQILMDVSQAVLQQAEGYQARSTAAFQEVVSDLYAGFLSAEARRGVKPPERGATPPLVRWGSAAAGPYTWPATATAKLGVSAAVVSLPAANAEAGLLAWPALAHETAGHDILEADVGLRDELARAVKSGLLAEGSGLSVADYWADRIDETAADVLGVLNMGPAAAVGLVGYFRALNGAWAGTPALRNVGRAEDPHPADIARAYLAAETVRLLSFKGAAQWADRLIAEADRDLGRIWLGKTSVTAAAAKAEAAAVAQAIVRTRLRALEGHALGEIQDWRDGDEALVADLRTALRSGGTGPSAGALDPGAYAAHAVAAAVYEAAGGGTPPGQVMPRMIGLLDAMRGQAVAGGAGQSDFASRSSSEAGSPSSTTWSRSMQPLA
jgi:hypothetical protein